MSTTSLDQLVLASGPVAEAADRLLAGHSAGNVALGRPAWAVVLAAIAHRSGRPLLLVPARDEEARDLAMDLSACSGTRPLPCGRRAVPCRAVPWALPRIWLASAHVRSV